RTSRPGGDSTSSAASCSATCATGSRSALGPAKRIAAPPGATRGRHHSAAPGREASAFATATPHASPGSPSARPPATRPLGRPRGAPHRQRGESRLPPGPVASGIDHDLLAIVALPAPNDRVDQVLDRVDRLPVLADHESELAASDRGHERLVVLPDLDPRAD